MVLILPNAVEKMLYDVDHRVLTACERRGDWHTAVKIEFEADYPDLVCLAVEADEALRRHPYAAAKIRLCELKAEDCRAFWEE